MGFQLLQVHGFRLHFVFQRSCPSHCRQFFVQHDPMPLVSTLCTLNKTSHFLEDIGSDVFAGQQLSPKSNLFSP